MENIFHIWPDLAALARDIGKPYTTVYSWSARGRIPAAYDIHLIEAARRRGKKLTLEQLARERSPKQEAQR
ncbi:carph-isopro domain-containing protein [Paracoccus wurundjeri]|uniref:carph-isopro domain-containing protein n=1 Tax=Paracoccus onubensis TaxID=1675788 RepID=UPI00351CD765